MTSTTIEERKSQQLGLTFAFVIYLAILTILYFLKLIGYPPEDESLGINYGLDLVGYGDIQTYNKPNDSKNNYDVKPADESPKEQPAKKNIVPPPTPKPVEKVEKVKTKVSEKPVIKSENSEKTTVIKENKATPKKVEVKTPPVETPTKPVVKPTPAPPTSTPPVKQVDRSVDDGSVMKKKGSSSSNGTVGTKDGVGGNNNGDGKKGEVGDKGHPDGDIDSKSQMGKPGGKGGGSGTGGVQVSGFGGWSKKSFSIPSDNSDETGKIVFSITVDDDGKVISINVVERTVSPSVANHYKTYIQNNLSKYLIAEGNTPDRATGTITINIKH